jgi:uncharacterized protein YdeI (YjbR/CyaY-like superfamily)
MAPKDGLPVVRFADPAGWERWLAEHAERSPGVWLKIAKKASGIPTVAYPEVLDVAICFGWIDGQRRPHDESFFLQRFTPRGPRSRWSQINCQRAERLIDEGRMQPPGRRQVQAAKADGRWEAAYAPQSRATVPEDFQRELDRHPAAREFFATLRGQNRYAFLYRINDAKRSDTRARRIATFIAMLDEGKTFY